MKTNSPPISCPRRILHIEFENLFLATSWIELLRMPSSPTMKCQKAKESILDQNVLWETSVWRRWALQPKLSACCQQLAYHLFVLFILWTRFVDRNNIFIYYSLLKANQGYSSPKWSEPQNNTPSFITQLFKPFFSMNMGSLNSTIKTYTTFIENNLFSMAEAELIKTECLPLSEFIQSENHLLDRHYSEWPQQGKYNARFAFLTYPYIRRGCLSVDGTAKCRQQQNTN